MSTFFKDCWAKIDYEDLKAGCGLPILNEIFNLIMDTGVKFNSAFLLPIPDISEIKDNDQLFDCIREDVETLRSESVITENDIVVLYTDNKDEFMAKFTDDDAATAYLYQFVIYTDGVNVPALFRFIDIQDDLGKAICAKLVDNARLNSGQEPFTDEEMEAFLNYDASNLKEEVLAEAEEELEKPADPYRYYVSFIVNGKASKLDIKDENALPVRGAMITLSSYIDNMNDVDTVRNTIAEQIGMENPEELLILGFSPFGDFKTPIENIETNDEVEQVEEFNYGAPENKGKYKMNSLIHYNRIYFTLNGEHHWLDSYQDIDLSTDFASRNKLAESIVIDELGLDPNANNYTLTIDRVVSPDSDDFSDDNYQEYEKG